MDKKRICSECGIKKEFSEFHKCKANKSGLQRTCKPCNSKQASKAITDGRKNSEQKRLEHKARSLLSGRVKCLEPKTITRLVQTAKLRYGADTDVDVKNMSKKWHRDHIVPLSRFDLKDDAQYELATSLGNIQLLTKADNQTKSSKLTMGQYASKAVFAFIKIIKAREAK